MRKQKGQADLLFTNNKKKLKINCWKVSGDKSFVVSHREHCYLIITVEVVWDSSEAGKSCGEMKRI